MSKIGSTIIFLTGAAVGGSAAAFVMYKKTTKKWMKLSDERVKSLEDYIDKLEERINSTYVSDYISKMKEDEEELNTESEDAFIHKHKGTEDIRMQNNVTYTRYSQISSSGVNGSGSAVDDKFNAIAAELEHPQDSDEDEDPDYIDEEEEERKKQMEMSRVWTEEVNAPGAPKIIPLDEFGSTGYLDEVTLYYYTDDDTLVTEDEEIIPNREEVIGDALTRFGFDKNDEKVIYVRNTKRSTDYEISKIFGAYSEDH